MRTIHDRRLSHTILSAAVLVAVGATTASARGMPGPGLPSVEPAAAPVQCPALLGAWSLPSGELLLLDQTDPSTIEFLDTGTRRAGELGRTAPGAFESDRGERLAVPVDGDCESAGRGLRWTRSGGSSEGTPTRVGLSFEDLQVPMDDGTTIAGTLILPAETPSHPLVVMQGGASWATRHVRMREALHYAARGVGAFVYDRRGFAASTGEMTVPFERNARDIEELVEHFAVRRPDVDPRAVGISTYSQSGWYGAVAAARSPHIAFVVMNVSPGTTVRRQELQRVKAELDADGFPAEEVEDAMAYMRHLSRFSTTGRNWEEYARARAAAERAPWSRYVFHSADDREPETWAWARMNWEFNPLPHLLHIRQPVLAVFGGMDRKVLPEVHRSILETAFLAAGNRDFQIDVRPTMNHSLHHADRPGRTAPESGRMAEGLLERRLEWVLRHVPGGTEQGLDPGQDAP